MGPQSSLLASGRLVERDLESSWWAVPWSVGTGLSQSGPWGRSVRGAAGSGLGELCAVVLSDFSTTEATCFFPPSFCSLRRGGGF